MSDDVCGWCQGKTPSACIACLQKRIAELEAENKRIGDHYKALEVSTDHWEAEAKRLEAENARLLACAMRDEQELNDLMVQLPSYDDQRVLVAAERLPLGALRFMSSQLGPGRSLTWLESTTLDMFVARELVRRIALADVSLPCEWTASEKVKTATHQELLDALAKAEAEGEKASAMTAEEREARYEAHLREHGYIGPDEQIPKRPRNIGREILDGLREIKAKQAKGKE